MISTQRTQDVRFDEVEKRERRRLLTGWADQRLELACAAGGGIRTADRPGPKGRSGQLEVPSGLAERVRGLVAWIVLRGMPPGISPTL